ncbi:endonuclease/exonuclease/phosphatase family protein [Micromonospora sp. WMMD1102]|uniref:endonuclease/exonuclease/phosphatase family protein n=1 Tax=Micromonospora sp. WMMD1102 TaxID=3016105 RepID=UPI0024151A0E|nr:endonuclease/exonuclease/phosphatase family protein [Micromonospora sp. WMMD1102]MDG4790755.1 endonuclease/exonuclease/phosphatase family protein [Micromonospora sp. WMMD1102]MDG4792227.1 endonuclease/exonuclease/phosphatase family protein [Micromonospora sp. WMMD1102]
MAGTAAPAASAAEVTASYNVWVWNVAGWKMHRGATGNGLIGALANSIRNRSAHFAALNELCWSQYKAVQSNLRGSGWPQDVENFSRFEAHNETACGGEPFGVAIFSRAPMGPADRLALAPDGSSERRKLLCAPLEARPHLRFCTTHITPSNEVIGGGKINERQLGEVLTRVESYHAAGDTVIIAGDFNAQPNYGRMNPWYSRNLDVPRNSGNQGDYRELDDTDPASPGYGETTVADGDTSGPDGQGKKIDMIFVREDRIAGTYTGDSLAISTSCGGACSDHRILIGTVTVRITT